MTEPEPAEYSNIYAACHSHYSECSCRDQDMKPCFRTFSRQDQRHPAVIAPIYGLSRAEMNELRRKHKPQGKYQPTAQQPSAGA